MARRVSASATSGQRLASPVPTSRSLREGLAPFGRRPMTYTDAVRAGQAADLDVTAWAAAWA